jgi:hypothetical protein
VTLSASDAYKPKMQELVALKPDRATVVWEPRLPGTLTEQVEQIRTVTAATPAKSLRRLLFFWVHIYVKDGAKTTINVRIPIPLPLVGALLPRQLSLTQVMTLRDLLLEEGSNGKTVAEHLKTLMAIEFIHVQDDDTEVVIGLD